MNKSLKQMFEEKYGISLGERLGTESSYGVVYVMPQKSRIVKIFRAKSDEHANREIAISTIMGENGVGPKLYNAGLMGEKYYYMVMERISGDLMSMPRWLRKKYEAQINDQIRKLMDKMHKLGFIHGDLKWDNIGYKNMKQSAPKIYIIDFGLSIKFPRDIRTNVNIAEGIARAYRGIGFRPRNLAKSPANLNFAMRRALDEIRWSGVKRTKPISADNIMTAALNVVNNKPVKVSIPKDKRVPSLPSKKKMVMSPLNPPYTEMFNGGPLVVRVPPPRNYDPLTLANELNEVLSVALDPNWKPSTPNNTFDPNSYRPYAPPTPRMPNAVAEMLKNDTMDANQIRNVAKNIVNMKSLPENSTITININKMKNIKINMAPIISNDVELEDMMGELMFTYLALLKLSYIKTRKGKLSKKQAENMEALRRGRDNLRKAIKRRFDKYNIKNVELL
jgi:tRNA A-37 threonylcarbamoyl transferase component Bud32